MERITLSSIVSLAKYLASDFTIYRPGMLIEYKLEESDYHLLEREVYEFVYNTVDGYKPKNYFELEVLDVNFIVKKLI